MVPFSGMGSWEEEVQEAEIHMVQPCMNDMGFWTEQAEMEFRFQNRPIMRRIRALARRMRRPRRRTNRIITFLQERHRRLDAM
jgi:hypothetical protein